jgi:hypothetical protein
VWRIGAAVFGPLSNAWWEPTWKVAKGLFLDFPTDLKEDDVPNSASEPTSQGQAQTGQALEGKILPIQLQYSKGLRDLTRKRLEFLPDQRPTLRDLKDYLDQSFPKMKKRVAGENTDLSLKNVDPMNVSKFQIGAKHRGAL